MWKLHDQKRVYDNCISCANVSTPSKHIVSAYCVQSVLDPPSVSGVRVRMVRPSAVVSEPHFGGSL